MVNNVREHIVRHALQAGLAVSHVFCVTRKSSSKVEVMSSGEWRIAYANACPVDAMSCSTQLYALHMCPNYLTGYRRQPSLLLHDLDPLARGRRPTGRSTRRSLALLVLERLEQLPD